MGWQDRQYNSRQLNYGGGSYGNPVLNVLFGSVSLGRWFNINVRVHASLLWIIGFRVLSAGRDGWTWTLGWSAVLFGIVLLHEFGHCIGARLVRGHAEEILLWPLGGLAFTDTVHTPWARFVTVACGPLVNVLIAAAIAMVFIFGYHAVPPLNPLIAWSSGDFLLNYLLHNEGARTMYLDPVGRWLFLTYVMNLSILFFNLIPMFPMDGGQLAQIALWKPLGYIKSMKIACYVGMAGAVGLVIYTIKVPGGGLFSILLAVFGFMACVQQLRVVKMMQAEGDNEQYDLSAAWDSGEAPRSKRRHSKRWFRSARKRALQDQAEQAKIDAILAKVKEKGLHSLSWWEKRTLKKATERQRQQDLANRL